MVNIVSFTTFKKRINTYVSKVFVIENDRVSGKWVVFIMLII